MSVSSHTSELLWLGVVMTSARRLTTGEAEVLAVGREDFQQIEEVPSHKRLPAGYRDVAAHPGLFGMTSPLCKQLL